MIRSLTRTLIAVAAFAGLAGTANAAFVPATWTDSVGGNVFIGSGASYSYEHDLTDDGFRPFTDRVTDFSLSIDFFDDQHNDGKEKAEIVLPEFFNLGTYTFNFSSNNWSHGATVLGLIELNLAGVLSVTVNSTKGDFYFGGSTLVANGKQDTRQVPEPGTLAMFGIGLIGVAAAARRRKANKI